MPLSKGDKFIINRDVGTPTNPDWKAYQVDFKDLALDLSGEITIDLPVVGYTDDISDIDDTAIGKLKFTSRVFDGTSTEVPSGPVDMRTIDEYLFHSSQREVLKAQKDEEIEIYNQNTKESVDYTLLEDGTSVTVGSDIYLQLKVVAKSGAPSLLSPGDEVTIRPLTVISGGGSINIGNCPPGYKDDGSGNCVLDPDYGDVEEGTLWFNPMNGILYIWYENSGSPAGEGQWVDVRPGGGGGDGSVTGDYIPLGSWNAINDLQLAP